MPVIWRRVALVLVFAASVNGLQKATPQASSKTGSPTLKETTDWLESHLVGVIHSSRTTVTTYKAKKGKDPREVDRQASNTHESVSAASFEGCSLTLGQLTKGDDYSVVTISTIPMDQLIGASWKIEKVEGSKTADGLDSSETTIDPSSFAVVNLVASTNVITFRRKNSGNVPLEQDAMAFEGRRTSVSFNSDDQEMPRRLVNAFNHAIDLCRADVKPEPF